MQNQAETEPITQTNPGGLPPGISSVPRIYKFNEIEKNIPEPEPDKDIKYGFLGTDWDISEKPKAIKGILRLDETGLSFTTLEIFQDTISPRTVKLDLPEGWAERSGTGGKPLHEIVALNTGRELHELIDLEKTKKAGWPVGKTYLSKQIRASNWNDLIEQAPTYWFCRQVTSPKVWDKNKLIKEATASRIACSFSKVFEDLYGPIGRTLWFGRANFDLIAKIRKDWESIQPPTPENEDRKFHGNWQSACDWFKTNKIYWRELENSYMMRMLPKELERITKKEDTITAKKSHPLVHTCFELKIPYKTIEIVTTLEDPLFLKALDKLNRTMKAMKPFMEKRAKADFKTGKKRTALEKQKIREEIANTIKIIEKNFRKIKRENKNVEKELKEATEAAVNRIGFLALKGGDMWELISQKAVEDLGIKNRPTPRNRAGQLAITREIQLETKSQWEHIFQDVIKTPERYMDIEERKLSERHNFRDLLGSDLHLTAETSAEKLFTLATKTTRITNAFRVEYLEKNEHSKNPQLDRVFPHLNDDTPANKKIPSQQGRKETRELVAPSLLELDPIIKSAKTLWNIRVLKTTKELLKEGKQMNHCVGGYSEASKNGKCTILSVSPKNRSQSHRSTVEIRTNNQGFPYIAQNKSINNRAVTPENHKLVKSIATTLKRNRGITPELETERKKSEALENNSEREPDGNILVRFRKTPEGYKIENTHAFPDKDPELKQKLQELLKTALAPDEEILWYKIQKPEEYKSYSDKIAQELKTKGIAQVRTPGLGEGQRIIKSNLNTKILKIHPETGIQRFVMAQLCDSHSFEKRTFFKSSKEDIDLEQLTSKSFEEFNSNGKNMHNPKQSFFKQIISKIYPQPPIDV